MAIGRISGPLLAKNLLRDGVDLAFETDLLYLDVISGRVSINTSTSYLDYPDLNIKFHVDGIARLKELIVNTTSTLYGQLSVVYDATAETYYQPGVYNTGSVIVAGGVAVQKDVWLSSTLHVNSSTILDATLEVKSTSTFADIVYITTATESDSTATGALIVNGGVGINKSVNVGGNFVATGTSVLYSTATILSSATAISVDTGALQVSGGVGVQGNIYSADGGAYENNLLYTPNITISTGTVAPLNPRVGDFWIAPDVHAWLQYIQDGDQRIWVQITTI